MTYEDIHSCSYHCQRPACALRQRDDLWALVEKIYSTVNEIEPKNRWTFDQAMAYALDKIKDTTPPQRTHALMQEIDAHDNP